MIPFIPEKIVKKYLGIPYKNRGRGMDGLDCWGLIVNVYKDYGVEVFDLENYDAEWQRHGGNLIMDNYYENWQKVTCYGPGDVVLMRYPRDVVGHAGIFLDRGMFIHATREGVVVSRVKDWLPKIFAFYRWTNIKTKT